MQMFFYTSIYCSIFDQLCYQNVFYPKTGVNKNIYIILFYCLLKMLKGIQIYSCIVNPYYCSEIQLGRHKDHDQLPS